MSRQNFTQTYTRFQNKDLQQIEQDFYEFRPHIYGFFSLLCLFYKGDSKLLLLSGILFAVASSAIFYMRYFSRNYR